MNFGDWDYLIVLFLVWFLWWSGISYHIVSLLFDGKAELGRR